MDKSPHQLAKTKSTSSEEFCKFVNRLLYEDASKLNFQQNMKISFIQNGRFSNSSWINSATLLLQFNEQLQMKF